MAINLFFYKRFQRIVIEHAGQKKRQACQDKYIYSLVLSIRSEIVQQIKQASGTRITQVCGIGKMFAYIANTSLKRRLWAQVKCTTKSFKYLKIS